MTSNPLDISRRMLGLTMGGLAAASALPAWAQSKAKPRALALVGDRYHNPDYIRVGLHKRSIRWLLRDL